MSYICIVKKPTDMSENFTKEEIAWFNKYFELGKNLDLCNTAKDNEINRQQMLDSKIAEKQMMLNTLDTEYEMKRKKLIDSIEQMGLSVESSVDYIERASKKIIKAKKEMDDYSETFNGSKPFSERLEEFKEYRKNLMTKQK